MNKRKFIQLSCAAGLGTALPGCKDASSNVAAGVAGAMAARVLCTTLLGEFALVVCTALLVKELLGQKEQLVSGNQQEDYLIPSPEHFIRQLDGPLPGLDEISESQSPDYDWSQATCMWAGKEGLTASARTMDQTALMARLVLPSSQGARVAFNVNGMDSRTRTFKPASTLQMRPSMMLCLSHWYETMISKTSENGNFPSTNDFDFCQSILPGLPPGSDVCRPIETGTEFWAKGSEFGYQAGGGELRIKGFPDHEYQISMTRHSSRSAKYKHAAFPIPESRHKLDEKRILLTRLDRMLA